MSKKEILMRTHRKKLVELAYLALLGRPAEESAIGPAVDAIVEKGYDYFLCSFKNSKKLCLENGFATFSEPPVDLSDLSPRARRIYAALKKAIEMKKEAVRA